MNIYIKRLLISLSFAAFLIPASNSSLKAQGMGVSFSFFFPKNGSFSIPISPFSLRGLGFNLNRYVALESGFTLYRMSGLGVTDVPFETGDPIIGPTVTLLVPLEVVLQVGTSNQQFRLKGGVFGFYNLSSRLINGNLDTALREYLAWSVLNSTYDYENNFGWGYQGGVEYIVYLTRQFGITLGANYFLGGANLNLTGGYTGFDGTGLQSVTENFPDARLDFTGWEISVGALFGN